MIPTVCIDYLDLDLHEAEDALQIFEKVYLIFSVFIYLRMILYGAWGLEKCSGTVACIQYYHSTVAYMYESQLLRTYNDSERPSNRTFSSTAVFCSLSVCTCTEHTSLYMYVVRCTCTPYVMNDNLISTPLCQAITTSAPAERTHQRTYIITLNLSTWP